MRSRKLPPTSAPPSGFWEYSVEVYGRPGVAAASLGLQDRLRLDVNLLLFCCWTGAIGRRLTEDEMARARASVTDWQADILRPLRRVRRRLKAGFHDMPADEVEALRRRLAEIELVGERIEQARLAAVLSAGEVAAPSAAAAIANLEAYLQRPGARLGSADRTDLRTLVTRCFPEAPIDAAFGG